MPRRDRESPSSSFQFLYGIGHDGIAQRASASNWYTPRQSHTALVFANTIWVIGGECIAIVFTNDVWSGVQIR